MSGFVVLCIDRRRACGNCAKRQQAFCKLLWKKCSRVAVIQGEVRVEQGATSRQLAPGEQLATSPLMESRSVKEEISWSRNAEAHLAMLQQSAAPVAAPIQESPETFEVASIRPSGPPAQGTRGGGGRNVRGSPCLADQEH